jgi:hypothetical protein
MSGRFDEMSAHDWPAFVVLKTWDVPYPEYVRYATRLELGSNAMSVGYLFGRVPVTFVQVVPPFVEAKIWKIAPVALLPVPAIRVSEFLAETPIHATGVPLKSNPPFVGNQFAPPLLVL